MHKRIYAFVMAFASSVSFSTSQAQDAAPVRFDVVSIRPHAGPRGTIGAVESGYEAIGAPLITTVLIAYAPAPFFKHFDDIQGLPSWAKSDLYDIRAKVAPEDLDRWHAVSTNNLRTAALLQQMLQPVLAERCNLRIHGEPSEADGLALTVGAKSPALMEDTSLPEADQGIALPENARLVYTQQNGERTYAFYNMSMPLLANYLTPFATSTVEDRTGLRGRYRFTLHRIVATTPEGEPSTDVGMPVPFNLSSIGLKANKVKVDGTRWIVESISKPTEN